MTEFDPDRVIDALAPLLDLPLDGADRAAIALHLRIAQAMAATVAAVPLADDAEPLPVFRP